MRPRRRQLTPQFRARIISRDGGICAYCGFEATEVDHVVPWVYGGDDSEDNLVACCDICNRIANDKTFDSFESKQAYVRLRYGPYLEGRVRRLKKQLSWCPDCENVFAPRINGASAVLCGECYRIAMED